MVDLPTQKIKKIIISTSVTQEDFAKSEIIEETIKDEIILNDDE